MNTQLIEDVVADFVVENKTFTAYDITTKLRDDYPTERWLHYQIKPEIHRIMSDIIDEGDYTREQDFSLHSNGPFVYKPVVVSTVKVPIPNKNIPPTNNKSEVELKFGSRDRLYIHGSLVKQILNGKDCVNIAIGTHNNDSCISVESGPGKSNMTYKIDHYYGFKIPKNIVYHMLDIDKPIYAEVKNDEVLIYNR